METKVNGIKFRTVDKEWDVYFDMALTMLGEIMKNNAQNKKTVMIVPVGPTDQYPILARMVYNIVYDDKCRMRYAECRIKKRIILHCALCILHFLPRSDYDRNTYPSSRCDAALLPGYPL